MVWHMYHNQPCISTAQTWLSHGAHHIADSQGVVAAVVQMTIAGGETTGRRRDPVRHQLISSVHGTGCNLALSEGSDPQVLSARRRPGLVPHLRGDIGYGVGARGLAGGDQAVPGREFTEIVGVVCHRIAPAWNQRHEQRHHHEPSLRPGPRQQPSRPRAHGPPARRHRPGTAHSADLRAGAHRRAGPVCITHCDADRVRGDGVELDPQQVGGGGVHGGDGEGGGAGGRGCPGPRGGEETGVDARDGIALHVHDGPGSEPQVVRRVLNQHCLLPGNRGHDHLFAGHQQMRRGHRSHHSLLPCVAVQSHHPRPNDHRLVEIHHHR
mmetsp:Transcript_75270/g.200977  ORF Transcript_75270/g.200977 Transcript_75270/m.200977 type:complete len:324 (+) Transcript_75270:4051-5022(+)